MTPDRLHLLSPQDYQVMPWKNGGGTTTELTIEPPGASLDSGFLWRLSMAEVGVSGPFSRFPGYDRTLLLLEGRGMRLEFDQQESVPLERLLEPVTFSGDGLTSGTLLDGPCRDFNVITQRAGYRHRLEVLRLDGSPKALFQAAIRFVYCISGNLRVQACELQPNGLLRIDPGGEDLEASGSEGSVFLAIGIDPVAP